MSLMPTPLEVIKITFDKKDDCRIHNHQILVFSIFRSMLGLSYRNTSCITKKGYIHVDLIQHQNFQEKRNPFHGRFTHKTARFWYAKLMNI